MDIPNSVTVRKRSKQPDFQENAPVQSFVEKQRSPSGIAVSIPNGLPQTKYETKTGEQATSTLSPALANNASFTQIPDSEGEDNDDFFAGEDFNFDSDILSPDTKKHQHPSPQRFAIPESSIFSKEDHNIVPESPIRLGPNHIQQTSDRSTGPTMRPPLTVNPSTSQLEISSSRSLSTPGAGYTVWHICSRLTDR
jgi:hypothetical protein